MRRRNYLALFVTACLACTRASFALAQDLDLPAPPPPGAEVISPDGFIPEGASVPASDADYIDHGFPAGGPVSMIDVPPTPVPYPGVENWEGFCNHHDGLLDVCCDDCGPCAWASLDVLWLQRDEGDNVVMAVNDDDVPVVQSSQFGFDYEPGLRLTYGRMIGCTPVEFSYFGTHNWNSTIVLDDEDLDDDIDVLVPLLPNGAFTDADFVRTEYSSDLHNLELNALRYDCCRDLSLLAGVRFISIDEELSLLSTDDDDGVGTLLIDANNYLIGPQVGGVFERCCGRLSFGAIGKFGVFANFAEADVFVREENLPDPAQPGFCRCQNDDVAMVAEAILGASYALGAGFSLRAGYQLTFINGVTLAPDLFGNTSVNGFEPPDMDSDSNVLYDGAYIGLGWSR
jgi:hypothetical protein